MQLESPDPGVSLQRIGELLFEKRSDGLPATRMRLDIAVVGRSNGRHLLCTRPSVKQTHGMVHEFQLIANTEKLTVPFQGTSHDHASVGVIAH